MLVNNAGITQPAVTVEETTLELWRDVIDTNLTGMFLCTRAALPLMQAGATIINNLSAAAKQVFPNYATYSAAKRGALGFTLSLREELIPRGIRVVALMPGATATDMWDQIMPDAPRERMIDVESVAQAVLYAVLLPPNANLSELCWRRAAERCSRGSRFSLFAFRSSLIDLRDLLFRCRLLVEMPNVASLFHSNPSTEANSCVTLAKSERRRAKSEYHSP